MRITLDLKKSVEQNAEVYFEKAKKAKKKLRGAKEALEKSKEKLKDIEKKQKRQEEKKKIEKEKKPEQKKWYEKFRWFVSSEEFLVIAGRDATTNEIIIKKHTEKNDIVFHTDMAGSPFAVVKTENKKPSEITLKETAQFVASYSRAWKLGLATLDVFYVNPDQVSKKTKAGEYMGKGAFMIYGKTTYLHPELGLAVGIKDNMIMAGPESAIKKNCKNYVLIEQGNEKTSAVAKKIKAKIGGDLDDIIRVLPVGCRIKS